MAYIGRAPVIGSYKKIDDLTSQFNGAQTVFTLLSNGNAVDPGTSQNLLISVGGVIQEPVAAYTVAGSTITFTDPPASTQAFFGVMLGNAVDVGTLSQGVSIEVANASVSNALTVAGTTRLTGTVNATSELRVAANTTLGDNILRVDTVTNRIAIGTSNTPQVRVQIQGSTDDATEMRLIRNRMSGMLMAQQTVGIGANFATSNCAWVGTLVTDVITSDLALIVASTEHARLRVGGNFGLGNTAPDHRLRVEGTTSLNGAVNALSTLAVTNTFSALGLSTFTGNATFNGSRTFFPSGSMLDWNNADVTLTHSNNALAFAGASSGYVFNDGSVGIGASTSQFSGNKFLHVSGTSGISTVEVSVLDGSDNHRLALFVNDTTGKVGFDTSSSTGNYSGLSFFIEGTERMTLNRSGNVGIGVTPSAWSSAYKALQVVNISLMGRSHDDGYLYINNYYSATGDKYINTGTAHYLAATSNGWQFYTAPSGTAGNSVTFTERFRILNGGNVAIGATAKFYFDGVTGTGDTYFTEASPNLVYGYAGGAAIFGFTSAGGNAFIPGGDSSVGLGNSGNRWTAVFAVNGTIQTSDRTRKHDISTDTLGLNFISKLRPVSFTMNDEAEGTRRHGLIAQEVIEAAAGQSLLGILTGDAEGDYGLNYAGFVPALIAAVQQQQAEINALKARIH